MAASLRLGRQGMLFGLRLSNFNNFLRSSHQWQDQVRHFFQSPWVLGKCSRCPVRTARVLHVLATAVVTSLYVLTFTLLSLDQVTSVLL